MNADRHGFERELTVRQMRNAGLAFPSFAQHRLARRSIAPSFRTSHGVVQVFSVLVKAHTYVFLASSEKGPAHQLDDQVVRFEYPECHSLARAIRIYVRLVGGDLPFPTKHLVITSELIKAALNGLAETSNNHLQVSPITKHVAVLTASVNRTGTPTRECGASK